jgi:succinate dehydrogenase/fumarate reductase flavoprotein subunit
VTGSVEHRHTGVLVVGGGAAGVTAALPARRGGASVTLFERRPLQESIEACRRRGGYLGRLFDTEVMA